MNWIIYTYKLGGKSISLFRLIILIITVQFSYNQGFSQNCQRTIFRSIDGTCNNIGIGTKDWGAADIPVYREMTANYASSNIHNDMVDWSNPRKISNTIFSQTTSIPSKNDLSSFVFTWGQFIDHDMVFSPGGSDKQNIPLPPDEPDFTTDISFTRSDIFPGTGIFSARDQINKITSWIDASQIYGSDAHRANWLRTFKDGKLKVSTGDLLPFNTIDGEASSAVDPDAPEMDNLDMGARPHFVAGDVRAGEQPGLTALHTLFVREHNRICDLYRTRGFFNDEVLYQLARKQVGAIIQAITYNEFLPALGVQLSPYAGYNASVQPDLMTEFSSAAYRIGHTMVTEDLMLLEDDCSKTRDNLSLEQAFFNGRWIAELGLEPFLKGLSVQVQEEIDAKVIDGLRNFLFAIPQLPGTFGMDLAALNIQRGRDHGLQDYNTIRAYFLGNSALGFNQINSDPAVWQALQTAYNGDINKVDAWVGMLCEEHLPNSNMGPTLHSILKIQFERSRDGDFYYYKNDPYFRPAEKLAIEQTSLADVIHNNTTLTSIQANAFKADRDNCGPTNSGLTTLSCGPTTIVYGNGTINMNAPAGQTYHFQVFNESWRTVFSCGWRCGNSKILENLQNGTYRIFIYNAMWQPICRQVIELTPSAGPTDVDGDGVPAGTDCNDNDANLTVVGADCNDGNPNTINDKVNDTCICEGTPTNPNTQTISCGEATITYGNGNIAINGKAGANYKFKVERVIPGWIPIDNCVGTICGSSKNYTNLKPGTYVIRMWSPSWTPMCDVQVILGQNLVDNNISKRSGDAVFVKNNLDLIGSTLYPNPATNTAYLTLPDYIGQQGEVLLVNNLGQRILNQRLNKITEKPIELDIQRLEVGIYQLQTIIDGQHIVNHKLVIKR